MFNYRIVNDKGFVVVVRARTRAVAISLFCQSEGCDRAYVRQHCVVRRAKQ
jgi:hypothetical protein